MKFEVLYHFSHGPVHLVETKRTDLPSGSSPAEIYQWSLIEDRVIHLLHFSSMSLAPQRRVFEEGSVEFDFNSCRGRLLGKDLDLTRQETLSDSLRNVIERALRTKK